MKVKGYFFNNRLFKLRLQHLSEFIKSFLSPLFILIEDRKCQWCIYRKMFYVLSAICIYWYASLVLLESMHLIMTKIYLWKMRVLSIVPLGCTLGILINTIPAFAEIINVIPQLFTLCAWLELFHGFPS